MATDHVSVMPASLKMPGPGAVHGAAEESNPPWMLLEVLAYVEKIQNATTAVSKTSDNKHIQITFIPRSPPLLSRFCIHSPDDADMNQPPHILAMEGDLALLRVFVGPAGMYLDYYVYQADDGSGKPSLTLLPRIPHGRFFNPRDIGMLRFGKEYIVAGFRFLPCAHPEPVISLCLYDSRRGDWNVYTLSLSPQAQEDWNVYALSMSRQGQEEFEDKTFFHKNCKVVMIGGAAGTVAFVDLWRGVLFCDILEVEHRDASQQQGKVIPMLGYASLPDDLARNSKLKGDARLYRDIAFLDGYLKCVDLSSRSLWIRPVTTNSRGGWSQEYKIRSFKEIEDSNPRTNLLPGQKGVYIRSFNHLLVCQPVVSLQDGGRILYFTVKLDQTDDQASVVAVDMMNKKILGVSPYYQRRRMTNFTYVHSRLSKHLKSIAPGKQAIVKQSGMVLQGSSSKMKDEAQQQHYGGFVAEDVDTMALD